MGPPGRCCVPGRAPFSLRPCARPLTRLTFPWSWEVTVATTLQTADQGSESKLVCMHTLWTAECQLRGLCPGFLLGEPPWSLKKQGPGALTRLGWSLAGRSREAPHGVLGRQLSVLPSGSRVCVGPSPSCVVQVSGLGLPLELCVSSLFRDCSRQVGQMLALLAAVRTISSPQAQRLEARSLAQGDLVAALARLGRGRCPRPADQWRLSHAILPGHCRPPAPSLPRTRYQGCHGRSP